MSNHLSRLRNNGDSRLSYCGVTLSYMSIVAGDQAVPDELLHCGDVLRVEQVVQKPQPMGGLWGFRVIFDREPVADDLRLALLKSAVQIQGSVCQCDTVGDRWKVLYLCRQLQHVYHIGDLLGEVRPNVFTHHLEDLAPQGHGGHHSAVRGEKCAVRVKQLVGAQKIATQRPAPDRPLRDGLGSGSLCSDKKAKNLLRLLREPELELQVTILY